MASVVPSPIVFDLSVADSIRIRKNLFGENGGRLFLPMFAVNGLLTSVLATLWLHRHQPLGWGFFVVAVLQITYGLTLLCGWWGWLSPLIRPQAATRVVFSDAGVEIERGTSFGRVKRLVPFAKMRSVRLTSEALIIGNRWASIVRIPKRALAGDGEELMSFLERHLVGTRSLRRSSMSATMIVNTRYP